MEPLKDRVQGDSPGCKRGRVPQNTKWLEQIQGQRQDKEGGDADCYRLRTRFNPDSQEKTRKRGAWRMKFKPPMPDLEFLKELTLFLQREGAIPRGL